MQDILWIFEKRAKRNQCIFRNREVQLVDEDGKQIRFPCIGLYEMETNVPLWFPRYERWYLDLATAEQQKSSTLKGKAYSIVAFMNFLLHKTNCNTINDLTTQDIRDFVKSYRYLEDGDERTRSTWNRGISDVYDFLANYQRFNSDRFEFHYRAEELITYRQVYDRRTREVKTVRINNKFNIAPPKTKSKKYRFLPEAYLKELIQFFERYNPMLALAIALQAYAGLREGEVMNLTRKCIKPHDGGYGRISRIEIVLEDEADFSKNYQGKKEFGNIKVKKNRYVYDDFTGVVLELLGNHEELLDNHLAEDAPLFVNKYGEPMTVFSYTEQVKEGFLNYFVPKMEAYCKNQGIWAENAPYLERYKRKNGYPGAHMFRHWFTMYLLKHLRVDKGQDINDIIAGWRGDSNPDSMLDYVHANAEMIKTYKNCVIHFQRSIFREVLNG